MATDLICFNLYLFQWYLLDHAFDSILEAGQIPHPLLFTEMILQLIVQENYEQAVTLVKAMGYAPFQVTERQWTELFEVSMDRICWNNLKKLSDALSDCDASEATVSNLSRSLRVLCKSRIPEDTSQSENMENMKVESDSNMAPWSPSLSDEGALGTNTFSGHSNDELSTFDLCVSSEDDEEVLNMLLDRSDDSYDSNSPSVNEILKTWKEERKTDGLFLHPLN